MRKRGISVTERYAAIGSSGRCIIVSGYTADGAGGGDSMFATDEQMPIEISAEDHADEIERDRIDARIDETQTEGQYSERTPHLVIIVLRRRMKMKPQHENVMRQKTYHEHDDEAQYHFGDFFSSFYLTRLTLYFARYIASGFFQVFRHHYVEASDHAQRYGVIGEKFEHDHSFPIMRIVFERKRRTVLNLMAVS